MWDIDFTTRGESCHWFLCKEKMSQFVGKWKVESEENLDELFKACGKSTFKSVFKVHES